MSAPKVDVELDERTKEELQPPCEFRTISDDQPPKPCEQPANFIARSNCPGCGKKINLLCAPHGGYALTQSVRCSVCKSPLVVLGIEPL